MILASHSRLSIPPETWYFLRLGELLQIKRTLTPSEIDRVIQIMTTHYRWPDLNYDASEFRLQATALEAPYLRDVVELPYQKHLSQTRKSRWGDKTPGYIAILSDLATLFPGAKFIHLIRDGRDVAKSFQSLRWSGRWLHDNFQEWLEAMDYNEKWARSTLSTQIFQVRYEDLVFDVETTTRKICQFLGEEFEPGMLLWRERIDELVPARESHIHKNLKDLPDATFICRWTKEMTAGELLISEAFMGSHLAALGYERRFRHPAWVPILALVRWYCRYLLPLLYLPVKVGHSLRKRLKRQLIERDQHAGSSRK